MFGTMEYGLGLHVVPEVCLELKAASHFLLVEDDSGGAWVYTLNSKLNATFLPSPLSLQVGTI